MTFRDYLTKWFSESTVEERMSFHNRNISILLSQGLDFEHIILNRYVAKDALDILDQRLVLESKKKQRLEVFKLYYNYKTGQWLDNWNPSGKRLLRKKHTLLNHCSQIQPPRSGSDTDLDLIFYDSSIEPKSERVPELTSILMGEYDRVLSGVREMFGTICDESLYPRMIPVVLSDETPVNTYPIDDETRASMIMELNAKTNGNFNKEDVLNILKTYFDDRVMGRYIPNNILISIGNRYIEGPYIVIYYKNIPYKTQVEYYAKMGMVLAHEYLHHLHHMQVGDREFSRRGVADKRVKEAIADFFAVWYLLQPNQYTPFHSEKYVIARERYESWKKNMVFNWPYSYALYLHESKAFYSTRSDYPSNIIEKFREVFFEHSFRRAYSILTN